MKQPIKAALAGLAVILFASLSLQAKPADDKKPKEDSTCKIEITGDPAKVRAALIKLEEANALNVETVRRNQLTFLRHIKKGDPPIGSVPTFTFEIANTAYRDTFTLQPKGTASVIISVSSELCVTWPAPKPWSCYRKNEPSDRARHNKILDALKDAFH